MILSSNVKNICKNNNIHGPYIGGDVNITIPETKKAEFVITSNAEIRPASYFTGRENELRELRHKIEERKNAVLISGMGGIGKTHLCRKLFYQYFTEYAEHREVFFSHIGYIEYNGNMDISLQTCLVYEKCKQPEANKEAAWRKLEELALTGKLLIIIDNVNKFMEEDPGLLRLNKIPGTIVMTSRLPSFSDSFESYPLGFLELEQCREIFEKILSNSGMKLDPEDIPVLNYIIDQLVGRHTITIELLAHLVSVKHWTAHKLCEELEKRGFQLEYHEKKRIINIQHSYEVLYDLSELTKAEKNVLEAFSILPYIPLQDEICNQWFLLDAEANENDDVFSGLYQKGWLQFDTVQKGYSLHPVFATFINEKCKPQIENHQNLIKACKNCLQVPENGSIVVCQKYIPYAETIIKKLDMKESSEQIVFLSIFAKLLRYVAAYKRSEQVYEKVLELNKKMFGENDLETANSYDDLAEAYSKQGDYRQAEKLYNTSLKIRQSIQGVNGLDIAKSYNNIARMHSKREDYPMAKELYEKCLKIREQTLGTDSLDTARTYNNLAYVYVRLGQDEKAEEFYKKCMVIREIHLGTQHPDTARIYSNLGRTYVRKGEYEEAEKLYKKCINIREEKLGKDHSDTARIYFNLAELYSLQKKLELSEYYYEKSLQIRRHTLGEKHPDTAESYYSLAGIYKSRGQYELALDYFFKAHIGFLISLGPTHSKTQFTYKNMGTVYALEYPNGDFEQWIKQFSMC